jgi:hypothetical protein
MSKRVSNKRGQPAGARSYATGSRGREKAHQTRQRELEVARKLNPEPAPRRTPSRRISVWARLRRAVRQWLRGLRPA